MARFADCLGRTWEFRLTTTGVRHLKEIGLDVGQMVTAVENLPDILFGDADRLATALYRLVRPPITPDEFGDGMDGPTLEAGGVALIEEAIGFFPLSRTAQAMKGKVREAMAAMDDKLASLLTGSSTAVTNSPASAA